MKLFFRKYGEGHPLLILHGLFGQSDNWNTLSKKYGDNGYSVYVIDQRNHGLSPHSDKWNYSCMAEDLMELIANEKLSAPLIMGHSMGGKTAMFFEAMFPGIASKLLIGDISPRKYETKNTEVVEALLSIDLDKIQSRKDAENALSAFGLDFGTKQFLLKNLYRTENPEPGSALFNWRFNLNVIGSQLGNISEAVPLFKSETPTLFLKGENSDYILSADETEIRNRFINAEIISILGSGHWIHAEKPDQFFAATLAFMNKRRVN